MRRGMAVLTMLAAAGWIMPAQSSRWRGTWIATDGARTLSGVWSATTGDSPDIALGEWKVLDASGRMVAGGTWSARKMERRWEGGWQARDASSRIYTGSWTAKSSIVSLAHLSDLFELSLSNVVGGSWRMGRTRAGSWSIRARTE